MTYRARFIAAAAVCLAARLSPAHASGNFLCEIDDASLKLSAESTFSHGLGAKFLGFGVTGAVLLKGAPRDLAELKFDDGELVHHWLAGGDLKLHLYSERTGEAPHGYVELIVETRQSADDETAFEGTYTLEVYDMTDAKDGEGRKLEAAGKAACSVG